MKHIRIVVLILCACFVSVAWGQQQQACKAYTPWAEFHRHDMVRLNPCEKVLGVKDVGNLGLKWSYATGYLVVSSPAVANGVVYVGSADGNVYALNASTGRRLWSYPPATMCIPRPPWRMGWFTSARMTATCTR